MTGDPATHSFEALAETCDAIVMITDYTVRIHWASSALERETGFTAADFQFPQHDNPFIHRDDAARVAAEISSFIASEHQLSEPIENRFLDRWGRTHRYRSRLAKIEHGGAPALLFVCRAQAGPSGNVDDRQYRALVESADDAIVRLDARGRFLFANARTRTMLGYSAVELGRLRLNDVVAPRDRALLAVQLARATSVAQAIRFDIELVTSDGRAVWVQSVLTELGRFGQPGELLAILRDVSVDPLLHASHGHEMMGVVVAGIARDIDAQLAAITASLEHARRAAAAAHLDDAARAAAHASQLATRLRACAEAEAPVLTEIDLDALIGESVHWMRAAVTRRAALHVALGGTPPIRGDVLQLQQLVMHLLVNASDAVAAAGSNVTIATGSKSAAGGAVACVTVSDDGPGMDEAASRRAFDPSFTTKGTRRGLGLAAVETIAKSHGGTVRMVSAPGRGTSVEIELPALDAR